MAYRPEKVGSWGTRDEVDATQHKPIFVALLPHVLLFVPECHLHPSKVVEQLTLLLQESAALHLDAQDITARNQEFGSTTTDKVRL